MTDELPGRGNESQAAARREKAGWKSAARSVLDKALSPSDDLLKRIRNWAMLLFLLVALAMAAITWRLVDGYLDSGEVTIRLVAALLADLALCFVFIVFAAYQALRKSLKSASISRVPSPLYLRLLRHLSLVALIPAVVTTVVGSSIIVVLGDLIFSAVREPMDKATGGAESYIVSQYSSQGQAIISVGQLLEAETDLAEGLTGGELRRALQAVHGSKTAAFDHLFIVDRQGKVVLRGLDSFSFDCDTVAPAAIALLGGENGPASSLVQDAAGTSCTQTTSIGEAEGFKCFDAADGLGSDCGVDWDSGQGNEAGLAVVFRRKGSDKLYSLGRLGFADDLFVFGQSEIDGEILGLHVASEASSSGEFFSNLAVVVLQWSIAYVAALAALMFLTLRVAIRVARRVSRPVEELAELADRVRKGDHDISFPEFAGEDEIAKLGRSFREMVLRLVQRQGELANQYEEAEAEKQKFDSVLKTVSAGVIGLDAGGCVMFQNKAAKDILQTDLETGGKARPLKELSPSLYAQLADPLRKCGELGEAEKKVTFVRSSDQVELLVRAAKWQGLSASEDAQTGQTGFVISIDDVTELTRAERAEFAAQAADKVAHNLRSPLQAMEFRAQLIEAKLPRDLFEKQIEPDYDVLMKQLKKIERLVDEFRTPGALEEVKSETLDVFELIDQFAENARQLHPEIRFTNSGPPESRLFARMNRRGMQDVFENLISNSVDAINDQVKIADLLGGKGSRKYRGEIRIGVRRAGKMAEISVSDNGAGLTDSEIDFTQANVSTRGTGRGNGLTIAAAEVKRHRGTFSLQDAPKFEGNNHSGAKAVIQLPLRPAEKTVGQ